MNFTECMATMAKNDSLVNITTCVNLAYNTSSFAWWLSNLGEPYERLDLKIVVNYEFAMLGLSLLVRQELTRFNRRLPVNKVTALTMLKQLLIESMNRQNIIHCSSYLIRQFVSPLSHIAALLYVHAIYYYGYFSVFIVIAAYVTKELLIKRPGFVENYAPTDYLLWIKIIAHFLTLTILSFSLAYYLTGGTPNLKVFSYLANIPLNKSGKNVLLLCITLCVGFGLCVVLTDKIINRHIPELKLNRMKCWLLWAVFICTFLWIDQNVKTMFPMIGIAMPFIFNMIMIDLLADSRMTADKILEEERNAEELNEAVFMVSNRVPIARVDHVQLEMMDLPGVVQDEMD